VSTIRVEDDGAIRTITLNRPERRNALVPEMQEELIAAFGEVDGCGARVVVLAGEGDSFCSGLDLAVLREMGSMNADQHWVEAERVARMFRALWECDVPTIAVVQGAAVAGGTGLATICDFTLAAPEAKFGYTEVRIGFVPALVSAFLTLQIGDKRARDLLLTGRLFLAEEAHRLGLVNEVVEIGRLPARTLELAGTLKANSPESMAATKRLLAVQNKAWLDAAIAEAMVANAEARATHDFREGVASFLEKRKPVWGKA
jgi:methylglutaconyl-CoA hydratase